MELFKRQDKLLLAQQQITKQSLSIKSSFTEHLLMDLPVLAFAVYFMRYGQLRINSSVEKNT